MVKLTMSRISCSTNGLKTRNDKKSTAQNRWKILSQSLVTKTRKNYQSETQGRDYCIGHFRTFGLIRFVPLQNIDIGLFVDVFQCSTTIEPDTFSVRVQIPKKRFTLAEIAGFNNTGNICVWPAEEVITYYALNNLKLFHDKRVLEVGGGMTCLAGLMIAKYSSATRIQLTDGNTASIENVKTLINVNDLDAKRVMCSVLEWSTSWGDLTDKDTYDIILSADCLFFENAHDDLVETMWTLLRDDGLVIVMAPLRGDTFHKFLARAEARGFQCVVRQNYNERVWRQHLVFKGMAEYEENKHYPLLLELTKLVKS